MWYFVNWAFMFKLNVKRNVTKLKCMVQNITVKNRILFTLILEPNFGDLLLRNPSYFIYPGKNRNKLFETSYKRLTFRYSNLCFLKSSITLSSLFSRGFFLRSDVSIYALRFFTRYFCRDIHLTHQTIYEYLMLSGDNHRLN